MPSLAIWKKDSSGSSMSMRRTAESRGFRREVSPFHLVTCGASLFWCVLVGGGWVGCCLFLFVLDATQVFCMTFALSQ